MIQLKRAYQKAEETDGFRVLVDRIWPRGVSKAEAKLDLWLKEVAPSTELRKWYNHTPEKFPEFSERYQKELLDEEVPHQAFQELLAICQKEKKVTLVYGAKDETENQAVVLKKRLDQQLAV